MSARIPLLLACSASIITLASIQPVFAQQAAQASAANNNQLEELVVTATRREERLQTVPVAVTAFTAKALEEKSIQSASDLAHFVPSLLSSQQSRDEQIFYLRGQGPNGGQGGSPGVVTYFADVPFYGAGPGIYFDLDNLQVLRGPQGTLFGKNTTGGAILFDPKKPTNNFEGYGQITLGSYNWHEFEGAINVPIIEDKLLVRAAADIDERDGFTHNVTTGQDLDNRSYWSFRLGITWRPTDDFENYFVYDSLYSHTNGTGIILQAVSNSPDSTLTQVFGPGVGQAALNQQKRLGDRAVATTPGEPGGLDKTYSYGFTDIATYNLNDDVTFKNIFGYRQLRNLLRYDIDGAPFRSLDFITPGGWNLSNEQFSDEFQIQGKSQDGNFNWIGGAFYEFLHPAGFTQASIGSSTSTTIGNQLVTLPITVTGNALGQNALGPEGITQRTEALFLQGTYNFGGIDEALDGLKFTAGLRYSWDYVSNSNFQTVDVFLPASFGGGQVAHLTCNPCINVNHTFQAPTWTAQLQYQLDPDTLIYAKGNRGYKSGGFNGAGSPPFQIKYESEYVTDVEIGVKADWDIEGMKLRTNLDAFHDDYRNAQRSVGVLVQLTPPPTPKQNTTLVADGNAEIQGVELDGTLIPFDGMQLDFSWAYIDAHYTKFVIPTLGDLTNLPYPFTPKNKFGFQVRYHLPFIPDDLAGAYFVGNYTHTSRTQYTTSGFEPFGDEPGYGLLDLSLEMNHIAGQPLDVTFFMTNVTDNLVKLGNYGIFDASGYVSGVFNEPRMWGFRIRYEFGGPSEEPTAAPAPYTPPPVQAVAPAPRSYLVFFDFNKSDLTPQAVQIVNQAAANAGPAKVTRLTVTGHTDTVGSDAYNMRLSRRRAESVAAQLEKDGIPSSEIEIVAKGKRDLLVPTADGVKEPQNRRVQIVYDGGAGM
jgi:iron complex outermembrane receptor protein